MNYQRKQLCLNYLKARKAFREIGDDDEVLHGNDNIVGRIGEAIAHSFLEQQGRQPIVVKNQSNEGYDIICEPNQTQVSVKMITSENTRGSTSKIRDKWHEFIGIELDANLKVIKLGIVSKESFQKELKKRNRITEPNFSRAMLKKGGVIDVAGKVYTASELTKYNLL